MLVYNGMLIGTGTVYKHLPATRSEREEAHAEHHTCPTGTRIRAQLSLLSPHEHEKSRKWLHSYLKPGLIWRQGGGGAGRLWGLRKNDILRLSCVAAAFRQMFTIFPSVFLFYSGAFRAPGIRHRFHQPKAY